MEASATTDDRMRIRLISVNTTESMTAAIARPARDASTGRPLGVSS